MARKLYVVISLILVCAFFLGSYLLESVGVQYVSPGGSPIVKIHVYSYFSCFLFLVLLLKYGLGSILARSGRLVNYWFLSVSALVFTIAVALYRFGSSGVAYLVVTVLSALLVLPCIYHLDSGQKKKILSLFSFLLLCNSCVALVEFYLQATLIPVEFTILSYFRSTAFLANPLNNALVTATLASLLMRYSSIPSEVYFSIIVLALFSFGGRTALAVFLLTSFLLSFGSVRRFVVGGVSISKLKFAVLQLLFLVALVALVVLVSQSGIADRISNKLFLDASAQARFDLVFLLEQLTFGEWLLGASVELKDNVSFFLGVEIIENYFVAWIVEFGLLGALPMLLSIFPVLFYFFVCGDGVSRAAIVNFTVISLSNNALATKTPILLFLYVFLACHVLLVRCRDKSTGC